MLLLQSFIRRVISLRSIRKMELKSFVCHLTLLPQLPQKSPSVSGEPQLRQCSVTGLDGWTLSFIVLGDICRVEVSFCPDSLYCTLVDCGILCNWSFLSLRLLIRNKPARTITTNNAAIAIIKGKMDVMSLVPVAVLELLEGAIVVIGVLFPIPTELWAATWNV